MNGDAVTELQVQREVVGGAVVLRVSGDVDTDTVGELAGPLSDGVEQALANTRRRLVIELSEVTYFGSAGLNALLGCHHDGAARGVDVRVVTDSPIVCGPVRITGVDTVVRLYPTLSEALNGRA